jgi:3'-phosphoadenosine 5'-phosphosulfate sulfotransferase (PAPS reductase)/FAD synthetase
VSVRAFSYGGGVQSTAALVLAARGEVDYPLFIFANVGDKAEHPASLAYVDEVAAPYAAKNGIELVKVRKTFRDGRTDDLYVSVTDESSSIDIPVRMANGAPGNRRCTADFKINVVAKELKRRGATRRDPAALGLGISIDEHHRIRPAFDERSPAQVREYPLADRNLTRRDCQALISSAGLPMPGRSACWFCPFHSLDEWRTLRRETPELFAQAVQMERTINARRERIGKDSVWMTRFARPLDEVVADQLVLDVGDLDNCESGYCLT